MASLRGAVKALLQGDATLGGLTSLVLDSEDVGRDGLQRKDLLAAPSSTQISPGVFIKWRSGVPWEALIFEAEQVFCEIYFYQEIGYSTCEAMRRQVKVLLHRQQVDIDDGFCLEIYWRGDITDSFDPALNNVSMERSRYEARITRE